MTEPVTVGLSGGVDSAVAAAILLEEGHTVSGVFMKNWDDQDPQCTAAADYEDVRMVCEHLGIPYYSVNFEREYRERVFASFLADYRRGRTPNPDVLCNSEIKFAAFLDFAADAGAQSVATGHYARTQKDNGLTLLLKGRDEKKDQSYFLCLLNQQQLRRVRFPLGGMVKDEVRLLARDLGLPVAEKKDSTGICFIGERRFKDFLLQFFPNNPGPVKECESGMCLGTHDGLYCYTLGQRRGLRIGGQAGKNGGRWFVTGKDPATNTLFVSQNEELLLSSSLYLDHLHFIGEARTAPFFCSAKIRYRQPDQQVYAEPEGEGWRVTFKAPQRAVTSGQYCVLYENEVCLGGGQISESSRLS